MVNSTYFSIEKKSINIFPSSETSYYAVLEEIGM